MPPAPNGQGYNKNKWSPTKKTIAIIATATTLGGVGAAYGYESTKQNFDIGTSQGTGPTVKPPEGVTAENASSIDFYNETYFTDADRIAWADEQLDAPGTDPKYPGKSVREAAYERVKAELKDGSTIDIKPLVSPSKSNTANEADIQMVTVEAAAMYELNLEKGKKMLAAAMRQDTDFYASIVEDFDKLHATNPTQDELYISTIEYAFTPADGATLNSTGKIVDMASDTSTSALIGSVQPFNHEPTRVVYKQASQTNDNTPNFEEVQVFIANKNWVAIKRITQNDVGKWIPPATLITLPKK
jgi:hypothetical protein